MNDDLIKFGGTWLPLSYLLADGYETTPNRRTELEAYRDANVYLHRATSPNHKTTLTLNFCPMSQSEKEQVQAIIWGSASMVNETERKVYITYWNDETNGYTSGYFYISDITYQTLGRFGGERWYKPFSLKLTEY